MTACRLVAPLLWLLFVAAAACGRDAPTPTLGLPPGPAPTSTSAALPSPTAQMEPARSPTAPSIVPTEEPLPSIMATDSSTSEHPSPTTTAPTETASLRMDATPPATAVIMGLALRAGEPSPGQEFTLSVQMEPRTRGISGVQFGLDVEPTSLEVGEIVPGDLLGPSPLEVKLIESESGILTYAAARRGKTPLDTPGGNLATIRLIVPKDILAGAPVSVGLRGVLVADDKIIPVADVFVGNPLEFTVAAAP